MIHVCSNLASLGAPFFWLFPRLLWTSLWSYCLDPFSQMHSFVLRSVNSTAFLQRSPIEQLKHLFPNYWLPLTHRICYWWNFCFHLPLHSASAHFHRPLHYHYWRRLAQRYCAITVRHFLQVVGQRLILPRMSSLGPIDRHLRLCEHCVLPDSNSLELDILAAVNSELASQRPGSNCRTIIRHHLAKAIGARMHLVD